MRPQWNIDLQPFTRHGAIPLGDAVFREGDATADRRRLERAGGQPVIRVEYTIGSKSNAEGGTLSFRRKC